MYKPKPIAMKRFYLFLAAFPLLFSSCSKTVTIEGRVTDASVNDIVVVTQTDTVSVSTIEADPSKVPGVLIGDVVKVEYELTEPESGVFVNSIRSLEIVSPSYYRIIAGTWTRKGINDADYYGFTLADDGSAESVNNNTLQVREWVLDGEELVLTADSVYADGNRQFSFLYHIEKLDTDSLVLSNPETGLVEWACARR